MKLIRLQIETGKESLNLEFSGLRAEGVFCLGVPAGESASLREKELYRCGRALAALFGYLPTAEERVHLVLMWEGMEYRLGCERGVRVLCQNEMVCSEAVTEELSERFARQVMRVDTAGKMLRGELEFYDPKPINDYLQIVAADDSIPLERRKQLLRIAAGENRLGLSFLDEITDRYLENLCYSAGRYFEKLSSYRYRFQRCDKRLAIWDLHSGASIAYAQAEAQQQFLAALSVTCGMQEMRYKGYGLQFPYLLICEGFKPTQADGSAVRSYFYQLAKRNAE